ncbi:alkyl sulfatase C-terminal domain-containing protein [Saccharopolyspora terrae]|uniref:alkyl sulfatase C-terminal domain-containing protein n=1 Tax=Saccharopolyspora terrae TaxID=2530384 RepID=UPI001F2312F3|nr:alkyl sulfatase C-terminal domain-containing protein [Saccharopolyspora terrae]
MGAHELRHGPVGTPTVTSSPDVLRSLDLDQLFAALATRVDGPKCWDADITIRWNVDGGRTHTQRLRNGVLVHIRGTGPAAGQPDAEVTLEEQDLRKVLLGTTTTDDLAAQGRATTTGDPKRITELFHYLANPNPNFTIVTP